MSSSVLLKYYGNKLFLNINNSIILGRLLSGSHLGALPVVASLAVPLWLRLVMVLAVVGSLLAHRRAIAATVGMLRIADNGDCMLTTAGGTVRGRIASASALPLFVRLVVKRDDGRSRALLILRDAVEPDEYRELRASVVQQRLPVRVTQSPT